jgi:hypothetical protein
MPKRNFNALEVNFIERFIKLTKLNTVEWMVVKDNSQLWA